MSDRERRLARLQGRITPPAPAPTPRMDLLLRLVDHRRQELDYADRSAEARGRGRLEEAIEPGPLALTLDERREMLAGMPRWLAYLAAERARAPAALADVIADAEAQSRESAALLESEIATMEGETND